VSLSVFYAPSGKAQQVTLDVMCKHPEVLRVWVLGIEMLMADHEQARGAAKVLVGRASIVCTADEECVKKKKKKKKQTKQR
jgi:hypothetical protein